MRRGSTERNWTAGDCNPPLLLSRRGPRSPPTEHPESWELTHLMVNRYAQRQYTLYLLSVKNKKMEKFPDDMGSNHPLFTIYKCLYLPIIIIISL